MSDILEKIIVDELKYAREEIEKCIIDEILYGISFRRMEDGRIHHVPLEEVIETARDVTIQVRPLTSASAGCVESRNS
jgi:hypothetical protein